VLAILPCRPKVVLLSEPSGCFVLISKGAPLQARPQRASSSSKPSSQPRPPRPLRLTNAGLTGPVGHGRVPAQAVALVRASPETHAARGNDREREGTVVDLDQVYPLAPAAAQPALADRAATGRGKVVGLVVNREALDPHIVGQIGQHERCHGCTALELVEPGKDMRSCLARHMFLPGGIGRRHQECASAWLGAMACLARHIMGC